MLFSPEEHKLYVLIVVKRHVLIKIVLICKNICEYSLEESQPEDIAPDIFLTFPRKLMLWISLEAPQ